jgi:O-antigen/teichoic acid export membrane protein
MDKAVSGVKWSAVSRFSQLGLQFLTTAVLARLLTPDDFGLVGMATVVIGFVDIFKDLGTSAAVIQRKNLSEELLSSIFWVNVAFGVIATTVLFALSPLGAAFYHEQRVTPILKVLSIAFFISGLSILQQAILERNLQFDKLAKLEIIGTLLGSIVGIGSALLGYGVWSLVYQSLTVTVVTTLLLWTFSGWRPKMIFHWDTVKSVSSYSLNLTGFNISNYFIRNGDYLLIGRFIGAEALGYYTLAYNLMLFPLQNISAVLGRVMFPAFSQIQDDDERFRSAYLRVAASIALVTFPMLVGLWAVAGPFVLTVFGSQWSPVILLIMILAPVGLSQSIGTTVGTIYQTKGRTDWMFRWGLASGSFRIIAFVIGIRWGVVGVAAAYSLSYLFLLYPGLAIPFRLIDLKIRDLGTALWRPFVNSLVMLLLVIACKTMLPADLASLPTLMVLVFTGIIVYILASFTFNREQVFFMLKLVKGKA